MSKKPVVDKEEAKKAVYKYLADKKEVDLESLYNKFPELPKASLRAYRMNHLKQMKTAPAASMVNETLMLKAKIIQLEETIQILKKQLAEEQLQSKQKKTIVVKKGFNWVDSLKNIDLQVMSFLRSLTIRSTP